MNQIEVTADINPLVSILLPAYNQEEFILDALDSVVSQSYRPLEIIIFDDASSDDTFILIEEFVKNYKGDCSIILKQNAVNLGVVKNIENIVQLAKGEIFVFAAGDDISLPDRVTESVHCLSMVGNQNSAVFSNLESIDEKGQSLGLYFKSSPVYAKSISDFISGTPCWALGASFAVKKEVFSEFGPINDRVLQEDGCYAFRALLWGNIMYLNDVTVQYRFHAGSVSQHNSPRKRLILQRNQYFMFLNWLKDASCHKKKYGKLIKYLRIKCFYAYFKHIFFNTPIVGLLYNSIRIFVKDIINNYRRR